MELCFLVCLLTLVAGSSPAMSPLATPQTTWQVSAPPGARAPVLGARVSAEHLLRLRGTAPTERVRPGHLATGLASSKAKMMETGAALKAQLHGSMSHNSHATDSFASSSPVSARNMCVGALLLTAFATLAGSFRWRTAPIAPLGAATELTTRDSKTSAASLAQPFAGKSIAEARGVSLVPKRRDCLRTTTGSRMQVASAAFDVNAWRKGFFDAPELPEGFYLLDGVEGLPEDLRGTYFRDGPGKFQAGGQKYRHQLDGDGLIVAITFNGDGQVCVRHRLVKTQGLLRDTLEKRSVSGGAYGTPSFGGKLFEINKFKTRNTANAGIVWWKGRLLAMWPFGAPYLIDPGSLGTQIDSMDSGASDLGGLLQEEAILHPSPKVCSSTGNLTGFAQIPSTSGTKLYFFEFRGDAEERFMPKYAVPRFMTIDGYTHFADHAVTPRWFILARPPVKLSDSIGATFGKPAVQVLEHDPQGVGEFLFVSRDKQVKLEVVIPVDSLVCSQFCNAYDVEDGKVVLDLVAADRWDPGRPPSEGSLWENEDPTMWPRTRLVRYEVDLRAKTWTVRELCSWHLGFTSVAPAVIGQRHRFIFAAVGHSDSGVGPMAGIAKIDTDSGEVDSWMPGPAEFGGEPQFVPRTGGTDEDDGYLVSVVFDGEAQRSDVVVLDASNVSRGPVTRFPLDVPVPHGLQGTWVEDMTLSGEEAKRKAVLLRLFEKKASSWNAVNSNFSTIGTNPFFMKQGVKLR